MLELTNAFLLENCLKKLNSKYSNLLEVAFERLYLYANFLEFPRYYRFYKKRNNPNLYLLKKLNEEKFAQSINFFIEQIKENNYDPYLIIFLYGYICKRVSNYYLYPYLEYFSKNKKRQKTKYLHSIEHWSFTQNIEGKNLKQFFSEQKNHLILRDDEKIFIKRYLKKIHLYSFNLDLIEKGLLHYKKIIKTNSKDFLHLKALHLSIRNRHYNHPPLLKIKRIKIFKKDYFNENEETWFNEKTKKDCSSSFFEIYQEALKTSIELIDAINQIIYYNNDKYLKTINLFAKKL